jgi:imidazole glycerol-phosphate synthase subunit HisH
VIALIDYGAGNLTSVRKALTALGADFATPARPEECAGFSAVIVPGVGNFAATSALVGPWRDTIAETVRRGTPLLGICLGMQWLFEGSDEAPEVPGLGVLEGRVTRLRGDAEAGLKIPHVGWNALSFRGPTRSAPRPGHVSATSGADLSGPRSRMLAGLDDGAHVYFTHSYAAPVTSACVAATTHGETFAAVVERGNVFGVQFHPEKSSDAGLQIIRNFLEVTRSMSAAARGAEAEC